MKMTKKPQYVRYMSSKEPFLYVNNGFKGIDLESPHNNVAPGYLRNANNVDLFKTNMKTRRGFNSLSNNYAYPGDVLNSVIWDTGSDDVWVGCQRSPDDDKIRFYWYNLTTPGAFDKVYILNTELGEQLELTATEPPDMRVGLNRIYVISQGGNFIIEHDTDPNPANKFTMRKWGLDSPQFDTYDDTASGSMTGTYTFGVELVYQVDGIDRVASTPSNTFNFSDMVFTIYNLENKQVTFHVDPLSLPTGGGIGDYWTHVRVYMSRNQNRDLSVPGQPIAQEGNAYELYSVATVSKADLIGASYNIVINTPDADLSGREDVLTIDQIGLVPVPAGYCGAYHKARLYVAGCLSVDLTESIIYYSNFADTKYSEQCSILNTIPVNSGDGKKIRKMISLNNDLVVFKETSTWICQNGNVDLPPTVIDKSIGVSSHRLANFVPKLGICALTSDNFDFKIFTESLHWTNIYNKMEVSRLVRPKVRVYAQKPNQISFLYINGKLIISSGGINNVAECLVLHVEQGLGFTTYTYPCSGCQSMFTFDNDSRAGIITNGQVAIEIEIYGSYQDSPTSNPFPIPVDITTWQMQSDFGNDLLEFNSLVVSGDLDETIMTGTAYVNETPWLGVENTEFKPNPNELLSTQRSGLYRLYLSKKPVYPWIWFTLHTAGEITIDMIKFVGMVNQDLGRNYLDRIQSRFAPIIIVEPEDETI